MKFFKIILFILLQGCSSNYEWGWYILSPENIEGLTNLKFLISGITTTIYIFSGINNFGNDNWIDCCATISF